MAYGQAFHASSKEEALNKLGEDKDAPKEVVSALTAMVKRLPDDCSVMVQYAGHMASAPGESSSVNARVTPSAPVAVNNDVPTPEEEEPAPKAKVK